MSINLVFSNIVRLKELGISLRTGTVGSVTQDGMTPVEAVESLQLLSTPLLLLAVTLWFLNLL